MNYVKWSSKQVDFIANFVEANNYGPLVYPKTKQLLTEFRKAFPHAKQGDNAINTRYYHIKNVILRNPSMRSNYKIKRTLASTVEFNPAKATKLDNILIDLIDIVSEVNKENLALRQFRDNIISLAKEVA